METLKYILNYIYNRQEERVKNLCCQIEEIIYDICIYKDDELIDQFSISLIVDELFNILYKQ